MEAVTRRAAAPQLDLVVTLRNFRKLLLTYGTEEDISKDAKLKETLAWMVDDGSSLYDLTFSRTVWRLYGGAKGLVM